MACLDEEINLIYGTTKVQLIEECILYKFPGLDIDFNSPSSSLG